MPEGRITAESRQRVVERAGGCCEYCRSQAKYAPRSFSAEHILARAKGGMTSLDNLALACQGCNNHKYDKIESRDPASGERRAASSPRCIIRAATVGMSTSPGAMASP